MLSLGNSFLASGNLAQERQDTGFPAPAIPWQCQPLSLGTAALTAYRQADSTYQLASRQHFGRELAITYICHPIDSIPPQPFHLRIKFHGISNNSNLYYVGNPSRSH